MVTSRNIRIAMVIFLPKMGQIREVLEIAFELLISNSMPIHDGNDKMWTYTGNGLRSGKQEHMGSVAKELMKADAGGYGHEEEYNVANRQ